MKDEGRCTKIGQGKEVGSCHKTIRNPRECTNVNILNKIT